MNISEHITYQESVFSQTAIRLNIENVPSSKELSAMQLISRMVFEPLRQGLGNYPIHVDSFYRSSDLNKAISGSTTSQHCKGEAIDMVYYLGNRLLFDYIKNNLPFDQLIYEFGDNPYILGNNPAWVHVSYSKEKNRKEILYSTKIEGETKYLTF